MSAPDQASRSVPPSPARSWLFVAELATEFDVDKGGSPEISTFLGKKNFVLVHPGLKKILPLRLRRLIFDANSALEKELMKPQLIEDCSGGTYFLRNSGGAIIAVFKPRDEEPYAKNNPKGLVQNGSDSPMMRHGVKAGESALREVAAFLLDRQEGFVSVPQAAYCVSQHPAFHHAPASSPQHPQHLGEFLVDDIASTTNDRRTVKEGPLVEYVEHDDVATNLSPAQFPFNEVHKIGIFDIRTMNPDRHDSNILVVGRGRERAPPGFLPGRAMSLDTVKDDPKSLFSEVKLVPIDHAYILPQVAVPSISWFEWCWLSWPQAHIPFSPETKRYIMSLDGEADAKMLKEVLSMPTECAHVLMVGTKFLQCGAQAGRTLYDIGSAMVRKASDQPSILEQLVEESLMTVETSPWGTGKEAQSCFLAAFESLAEQFFEELSPPATSDGPRGSFGGSVLPVDRTIPPRFPQRSHSSRPTLTRLVSDSTVSSTTQTQSTQLSMTSPLLTSEFDLWSASSSVSLVNGVGDTRMLDTRSVPPARPIPVFAPPLPETPESSPSALFSALNLAEKAEHNPVPHPRIEMAVAQDRIQERLRLFPTKDDTVDALGHTLAAESLPHSRSCHTSLFALSTSPTDI